MIATSPWTDDLVSDLRAGVAKGRSFGEIAHALTIRTGRPFSRSAVAGKWFRLPVEEPAEITPPRRRVLCAPRPLPNKCATPYCASQRADRYKFCMAHLPPLDVAL